MSPLLQQMLAENPLMQQMLAPGQAPGHAPGHAPGLAAGHPPGHPPGLAGLPSSADLLQQAHALQLLAQLQSVLMMNPGARHQHADNTQVSNFRQLIIEFDKQCNAMVALTDLLGSNAFI